MLTSKKIGKTIEERFDISGVEVHCSGGVCRFYSDTNEEIASTLAMSEESTIYVNKINQLDLEQWLECFAFIIREKS